VLTWPRVFPVQQADTEDAGKRLAISAALAALAARDNLVPNDGELEELPSHKKTADVWPNYYRSWCR
jgi:hypothetical protein